MPLKQFAGTVMVNLVGSFNVAKGAADLMQHNAPGEDAERGVIVNTASVAAYEGQIGQAAYSASKAGVVGMSPEELAMRATLATTLAAKARWLRKISARGLTLTPKQREIVAREHARKLAKDSPE
jgi:NAD(P)-dependent dehydrogenase (short-subunit alcohol dehydrogenase family)